MLIPNTHCKGCADRYPGCHGKCEDYKAARAEFEKLRDADRKERAVAADQYRRILEAEKRTRRWKK